MCGVVARRRPDSDEPLCRSCDTPPLFASGAGERAASEAENASARRRRPGGRGVALESLGPGRDLASRMFNTLMMHYEHFSEIRIFLGKGTERKLSSGSQAVVSHVSGIAFSHGVGKEILK